LVQEQFLTLRTKVKTDFCPRRIPGNRWRSQSISSLKGKFEKRESARGVTDIIVVKTATGSPSGNRTGERIHHV
jgi:hypothetical protein